MSVPLDHQPGDVIFFRNDARTPFVGFALSIITKVLDRSPYTHAGIVVGHDRLAHISGTGSEVTTITSRWDERFDYGLIATHRPDGATAAQLVAAAGEGERLGAAGLAYNMPQLFLAGGLLVVRRKIPWWMRWMARPILTEFNRHLAELVDGAGDMICSDFVYRCFDHAHFELLPSGLPDVLSGAEPDDAVSLVEWLDQATPTPGIAGLEPLTGDLEADLRRLDPYGLADLTDPTAGPDAEEVGYSDAELAATRAVVEESIELLRVARGPAPLGSVDPDFITPGDLVRGGRLPVRDRWAG